MCAGAGPRSLCMGGSGGTMPALADHAVPEPAWPAATVGACCQDSSSGPSGGLVRRGVGETRESRGCQNQRPPQSRTGPLENGDAETQGAGLPQSERSVEGIITNQRLGHRDRKVTGWEGTKTS